MALLRAVHPGGGESVLGRYAWGGGINHFILEKKGVSINVLILVVYSEL